MAGIDLTDEQIRAMDPSERKNLIERLERPGAAVVPSMSTIETSERRPIVWYIGIAHSVDSPAGE